MGFFKGMFWGRKEKTLKLPEGTVQPPFPNNNDIEISQNNNDIEISQTEQGRLIVKFLNGGSITTLVIDNVDYFFEDGESSFQKCMISHRNQFSVMILKPNEWGVMIGGYYQIYTRVDRNKLQEDELYCRYVMDGLLNRDRVERYINMGMQEHPKKKCGNYVGEVFYDTSDMCWRLGFDNDLGSKIHDTQEMREKREKYKQDKKREEEDKKRYRDKKREDLLAELDQLEQ